MRISDWSSDLCSSDLRDSWGSPGHLRRLDTERARRALQRDTEGRMRKGQTQRRNSPEDIAYRRRRVRQMAATGMTDREMGEALGVSWRTVLRDRQAASIPPGYDPKTRSEEHTSQLQSLMRTSYAVL